MHHLRFTVGGALLVILAGCGRNPVAPSGATAFLLPGTYTLSVYVVYNSASGAPLSCKESSLANDTASFPVVVDADWRITVPASTDFGFVATPQVRAPLTKWSVSGQGRDPQTGVVVSFSPLVTSPDLPIQFPEPALYGELGNGRVVDGVVYAVVQFALNSSTRSCPVNHWKLLPR
jgi:hypothetical protein